MRLFMLATISLLSVLVHAQPVDSLRRLLENHAADDTVRFRLLINLSDVLLTDPPASKRYLDEANALAKELGFKNGVGESYCSLAHYYWNLTEYPKALEHALLALRIYESTGDAPGLYETRNTLAGIHTSVGEFDKAQEQMKYMLDMGRQKLVNIDYAELYHNMGWLMLKLNRNEEGLDLINKSLEIFAKRKGNEFEIAQIYFLRAKALQALEQRAPALLDFRKSIQLSKVTGHPNGNLTIASAHEGMADIHIQQENFSVAEAHLDTAFRLATAIRSPNLALKLHAHRVALYTAEKNFEKALEYERLRSALADSILNSEKARQLADAQTKYETEKKEQMIQLLARDTRIQALWRNILAGGLLVVVLVSATLIAWLRYREKKNKKLFDLQIDYLTARHQQLSQKYKDPVSLDDNNSLESQDQRFLRSALEVVERHLSDPLFGVEKLAEEMAMTRANLYKRLKSISGTTPSDFIRSVRLKRAASLLLNQVDSVSQIAFAVGFEDQSYFSKAFKKQFGISPSEYGSRDRITVSGGKG